MVKRCKRQCKRNAPYHCANICSRLNCKYFAVPGKRTCTYCAKGLAVNDGLAYTLKCKKYKQRADALVEKLAVSEEVFSDLVEGHTNYEIITFLAKVAAMERALPANGPAKLYFTAKQVEPLMQGYRDCSVFNLVHQKEATINVHDKILGRVLDHWNLGRESFPPAIRCYWGFYGDYTTPIGLYENRDKAIWSEDGKHLGVMKALLYCARVGDKPCMLRMMNASATLQKFKKL
jgi:hypothetical protein